jgi:hypothetical protein
LAVHLEVVLRLDVVLRGVVVVLAGVVVVAGFAEPPQAVSVAISRPPRARAALRTIAILLSPPARES